MRPGGNKTAIVVEINFQVGGITERWKTNRSGISWADGIAITPMKKRQYFS
jgi:hypothetical protein